MLGVKCHYGQDMSLLDNEMKGPKFGQSYFSFDFRRQLFVIKIKIHLPEAQLPPALRPLDAELSFEDIASQGIRIDKMRVPRVKKEMEDPWEVVVTISTRRPPKFYTKFEGQDALAESIGARNSKFMPVRRRATAMDFVSSGVVSWTHITERRV